jgi:hypothetical protein
MERREFLKLGASAALGLGFQADPLSTLLGRSQTTLTRPVLLADGDVVEDAIFLVGDDFQWDSTFAVFYAGDRADVTFRNVTIQTAKGGWDPRWNEPVQGSGGVGIPGELSALKVSGAQRMLVDNVRIHGFPRFGIAADGLIDCSFRGIEIDLCHSGLFVSHQRPSFRSSFEDVHVRDSWGGSGFPSAKRPGGYLGGIGIALGGLRACTVENCSALGENSGIKLLNPMFVQLTHAFTSTLMIQGDVIPGVLRDQAQGVLVQQCVIDKSHGRSIQVSGANALQVSDRVSGLRLVDCTLHAGGQSGAGMQLARECHADVRGCTFIGFNGVPDGPATYAVEVSGGSTLNQDFLEVNRFFQQDHVLRIAGAS